MLTPVPDFGNDEILRRKAAFVEDVIKREIVGKTPDEAFRHCTPEGQIRETAASLVSEAMMFYFNARGFRGPITPKLYDQARQKIEERLENWAFHIRQFEQENPFSGHRFDRERIINPR